MKNILIILISILLITCFPILTKGLEEQTCVRIEDRQAAILLLKDQYKINGNAKLEYMERVDSQNKDKPYFKDIKYYFGISQIEYSYNWGIISGYPDGTFKPNKNVSGLESILILNNMMNILDTVSESKQKIVEIVDIEAPNWAKDKLQSPNASRIIQIYREYEGTTISRLEFAIMLSKTLNIKKMKVQENCIIFLDSMDINRDDLEYLNTLRNLGILVCTDGNFYPNKPITRGEAIVQIARLINIVDRVNYS